MYGAVLLGALLVTWADGGWITLLCWLGLISVLWAKSDLEEKFLGERYSEYEEFRRNTPRWIPFWPMGRDKWRQHWGRGIGWSLIVLLLAVLGWQAFEGNWDAELFDGKSARNVRAGEAAQLIGAIPDLLVLDVRSEWEFARQRIPGAINIPIDDFDFDEKVSLSITEKSSILVYCAGGYRSRKAVSRIKRLKTNLPLFHLHRGMLEWP